jgi:sec-independent protein translocase protein TatC
VFRRFLPSRLSPDQEATLVEHLTELRQRLIICALAIIPAFAVAYAFHSRLISRLIDLLPDDHATLVTLGVTEPFTTSLKVSFYAALAIVLPIILWQIWSFFAPAVSGDIQRILGVFVVLATALFAAGVAFSYAIVLPRALEFLVDYDAELYTEQIRASYFLSFVTLTLFASGLAFQMPIFILALVRIGVLSSDKLRRNRRIGIAVMVCFAVLLPTVDPVSLVLEVVPLLLLFELSIWLSVLLERRMERVDENEAFDPS